MEKQPINSFRKNTDFHPVRTPPTPVGGNYKITDRSVMLPSAELRSTRSNRVHFFFFKVLNKMGKVISIFLLMFFLISCASSPQKSADSFIAEYGIKNPTPHHFKVCYSHGCNQSKIVQLNENEWERIRKIFETASTDASMEREKIAQAISILESTVGKLTGTDADIGGTFPGTFMSKQMDCEDEAINTSTYLLMLKKDGMINFHDLREPARRGYFLNGWPHMAPVIVEKDAGKKYVVDAWFLDNGKLPFILTYNEWKDGWRPEK